MIFFIYIQNSIDHSVSSGDPDQTPPCPTSEMGLHRLSMPHKKDVRRILLNKIDTDPAEIINDVLSVSGATTV